MTGSRPYLETPSMAAQPSCLLGSSAVRRPESVDSDCRPLLQIGMCLACRGGLSEDNYKAALYYIGMPLRMTYSFVRCSYNWPPFEQQKPF
ncbi:hypothetical protein M747DRAFT_292983 [Aspergillus niger ATCC 13496]|uniref:Uncharacterized protein n=1 Tax=Aspergillus niger ATCC 13496 TaxID=1353008 RepID=A0A370CCC8_ASPNG|nr:hypothetical protein M747DRAFT_292983 [Aspergillus niger ATCC 13496]